jgi:hypothetical protein
VYRRQNPNVCRIGLYLETGPLVGIERDVVEAEVSDPKDLLFRMVIHNTDRLRKLEPEDHEFPVTAPLVSPRYIALHIPQCLACPPLIVRAAFRPTTVPELFRQSSKMSGHFC